MDIWLTPLLPSMSTWFMNAPWHQKICAILPLETVGRIVQIFFVSFHFKGFSYKKWTFTFIFFSVHASCTNGLGQSRSSKNVEEVQTLGQVPEAPSNPVDFVHPSNTSVRLDLFMWNKQTCPVDYFIVSYRKEMVSISILYFFFYMIYIHNRVTFIIKDQEFHWTKQSSTYLMTYLLCIYAKIM